MTLSPDPDPEPLTMRIPPLSRTCVGSRPTFEPWNQSSTRVAERCGYLREGLLRSHQEIGAHDATVALCRDPGLTRAEPSVSPRVE